MRVHLRRGSVVESTHHVEAVVLHADGSIAMATPGADRRFFLRSAAKPFQAAAAIDTGVSERFGLTPPHLAVGCASHNGSKPHVDLIEDLLARAGLDRSALQCGYDGQGDQIHHQCSGNHALCLATTVHLNIDPARYLDPTNEVQQAMNAAVANALGEQPKCMTDNCGMPTHLTSLAPIARAFRALALAPDTTSLGQVASAMRDHPELVRWAGEVDTEIMRAGGGGVAKVGAEGLVGIGWANGEGIAVRVTDGALRAVLPAALALTLEFVSLKSSGRAHLRSLLPVPANNAHGQPIGSLTVDLS